MSDNPNFSDMTKAGIAEWAEAQGVEIPTTMTKDEMISQAEAIAQAQDAPSESENGAGLPSVPSVPSVPSAPSGTVGVTITSAPASPNVTLRVNGRASAFPVGTPINIDASLLPALRDGGCTVIEN